MLSDSESNLTIYFDGVCNLCNGFVNWLIKHEKSVEFRYTSLQGETAKESLSETMRKNLSTVVVQKANGQIYTEAQALILLLNHLSFPYPLLAMILGLFPNFILQHFYQIIAKNRYRLFGQKNFCRVPSDQEKKYFLP